ncbi:MAG: tRNA pseudouridine(55) synthase TruB [Anaerolineae bacterium]
MLFGLLSIDKPAGPTSHDIVAAVRRGVGERRIGHAGTLDPLATGVLVLALGPATRLLEYLAASTKSYRATIRLGVTTPTYDLESQPTAEQPLPAGLTREVLEDVLERFRGEIEQIPPPYSAVKIGGQAAHRLARAGERVELAPRRVTIFALTIEDFSPPLVTLSLTCSAGTYVRSLAHDLGQMLGCGAALSALTRTASGRFRLEDAAPWADLRVGFADGSWRRWLLPPDLALDGTPQITLSDEDFRLVMNGMPILAAAVSEGLARAYGPDGQLAAVLAGDPTQGRWLPRKVFAKSP